MRAAWLVAFACHVAGRLNIPDRPGALGKRGHPDMIILLAGGMRLTCAGSALSPWRVTKSRTSQGVRGR